MFESSEQAIFLEALDFESEEARAGYLDKACAGNAKLRASVEKLLGAHALPENPLDHPVAILAPDSTQDLSETLQVNRPIVEGPGALIGPYRLMEQIGEGGFGLVFVAEQQQPVRRKVALKVVKPGMDSRDVIARFEAERQALAMMDHPNIARAFDAGTTSNGRPYFVMELVRGVPITEFCDQHELSLRQRLEIFTTVCRAVQHAHQKGVVHRDIKPSNVLVTLHDETPVPKVIDFGVAKAIGQSLTDKTIYTRFTAMIGTPLYMSPEQAEMSGLDIDTRSDIYSLGVLLYELLTGSTPFEREQFNSVGLDEVRRIIREVDPPKPSTRLTTVAATLSTTSATRVRNPLQLSSAVRGDLDWIVMKALEKDRGRRYASASELADDVRRFLAEQPIEARPPSQLYQLSKFARRNKAVLVTVSLIAAAMMLGTAVSLWQASVAFGERNDKDAALQKALRLQQEADAAREEIAQFATRMKEANVLVTSGRAHVDAQRWAAAYADFTEAIERQPNYYNAWTERASLEVKLGLWELAARDFSQAIELGVPGDNPANWAIPQLFLLTGDTDTYREYCTTLLQQAEQRGERPSISLIRSCVLASNPVGDPEQLADQALAILAEMDAESARESQRRPRFAPWDRGGPLAGGPLPGGALPGGPSLGVPPEPPVGRPGQYADPGRPRDGGPPRPDEFRRMRIPRGVAHYTTAIAMYRAKRYDEAITYLSEALADDRWRNMQPVYPALAMAYHRSGDADRAREAYERSQQEIDALTQSMAQGPVGAMPIPWFDWIECQLLHREASILLTGFAPADDPRLRDIQQRGRSQIEAGEASF
ncbi:Serine/threonine-protein kinase PknB [Stieleria neptunia]|uniref:Serine/threonine-protein kinase PknB n=1 Tax=Stieleria neptunia TaxID=2527979 RepID=A0A518HJW3_9BACT|nr:serine/threonine-protein kinase [Stieleria neptunia]QDV41060.1 Serine/threonine-protein kinase PknB [Stieleria neptunia]